MLLFELMVEARIADLDREFDAIRNRTGLLGVASRNGKIVR
ncbi:MAG TPA: hypothetical protein VIU62_24615 [Chloroflexota bacterium]